MPCGNPLLTPRHSTTNFLPIQRLNLEKMRTTTEERPTATFKFDNAGRHRALAAQGLSNTPKATSTGTTIVGVCFKDGVCIAADTRATGGTVVAVRSGGGSGWGRVTGGAALAVLTLRSIFLFALRGRLGVGYMTVPFLQPLGASIGDYSTAPSRCGPRHMGLCSETGGCGGKLEPALAGYSTPHVGGCFGTARETLWAAVDAVTGDCPILVRSPLSVLCDACDLFLAISLFFCPLSIFSLSLSLSLSLSSRIDEHRTRTASRSTTWRRTSGRQGRGPRRTRTSRWTFCAATSTCTACPPIL